MTTHLRAVAIAYLLVQAVGIIAWWVWLHALVKGRAAFAPHGSENALMSFAPGDLIFLALVALAGAAGLRKHAVWAGPILWLHAGAGAYASCWAFALAVREPARAAGAAMMAPLLFASIGIALWFTRHEGRRR